ncbi:hypothetical protein BC835DRAFT_1271635 [Cytidiella melzeri]|nr:hypothetical protein BC835DRAFT_1271635 [Cytidiella melzeri]
MGLTSLLYAVFVFWVILHAIHRSLTHHAQSRSILPSFHGVQGRRRGWLMALQTRVTLQTVYVKLETTGFNDVHDTWASRLNKTSHAHLKMMTTMLYDLGSVAGALGMLAAFVLLCVTVYRSLCLVFTQSSRASDVIALASSTRTLAKRALDAKEDLARAVETLPAATPLNLILPGVTVPLSHLPVLLVALFLSQVIHELGHAITAALESIPLSSVGASLFVIVPSAFVSLPAAPVQALPTSSKLRIITSGAFHNLILWALLYSLSSLRLGHLVWTSIGYQDVSHYGRVVVSVDELSPLHEHLPIRSVITDLDDQSLVSTDTSADIWTTYLLEPMPKHELGWCVDSRWFLDHPSNECCNNSSSASPSQVACFSANDVPQSSTGLQQRCVSSLAVLQPDAASPKRCKESVHCESHKLCIKLGEDTEVLRVKFRLPRASMSARNSGDEQLIQTVVWSGPREEMLEEVHVSKYSPRYWFLPIGLPDASPLLFNYISTLTLSLYFFNLIPLPHLDGSQLLEALLDLIQERTSPRQSGAGQLELGSSHYPRSQNRWRTRVTRGVQILSIGLILESLSLGLYNAM